MTILLDWFYKSVDYNIDNYEINWKTFVNKVDTINSDDTIKPHTPHTRYSLYNGKIVINKEHPYYNQITMQMALTGTKWCDFVVYSRKGIVID